MNDKQLIAQKIIDDATARADAKSESAQAHVLVMRKQTDDYVAAYLSSCQSEAQQEAKLLVERRVSLARLESKKAVLSAKQKIMDEVFDRVVEKLKGLSKEQYLKFILKGIEQYAQSGDTVVIAVGAPINAGDLRSLSVFSQRNLKIAEGGNFNGGIMIVGKKMDIDLSFSAVVADYRDKNGSRIAALLFDENE